MFHIRSMYSEYVFSAPFSSLPLTPQILCLITLNYSIYLKKNKMLIDLAV